MADNVRLRDFDAAGDPVASGVLYADLGSGEVALTLQVLLEYLAANGGGLIMTAGAPSAATGLDGQIAFDPGAGLFYGPKSGGVWPAGTALNLSGAQRQEILEARDQSVTAASTASSVANLYDNVEAAVTGPNAVAVGAYFSVPSTTPGEATKVYKNVDGTVSNALLITAVPNSSVTKRLSAQLPDTPPSGLNGAIMDGLNRAAFGVRDSDGHVMIGIGEIVRLILGSISEINARSPIGASVALQDSRDAAVAVLDPSTGTMCYGKIKSRRARIGTLDYRHASRNRWATTPAEIVGFSTYGQSLSIGAYAHPAISTSQRFSNLMFVGGVRSSDAGGTSAGNHASLVPLVESDLNTDATAYGGGETPCTGMSDMFCELLAAEEPGYLLESLSFLCSAPGVGGTSLSQLSKGGALYPRLIDDITYGFQLAQASGKSYVFKVFAWVQGEKDTQNGTTAAQYQALFAQLLSDINSDAKSITGQTDDVRCVSYQVSTHKTYGAAYPTIALAQLANATASSLVSLACPTYIFDYQADGLHLTNLSSKILGAYLGLAAKRATFDVQQFLHDWRHR